MHIPLTVGRSITTAVRPTDRVCQVASMFGLGLDAQRTLAIVPPLSLTLAPGQILFITGASGGGKTTLLRLVADALADRPQARCIDLADLPDVDDRPLVETLGRSLEQAMAYLAMAGLNDAFVMLRRPAELSDGQRYRYRLARAMERVEQVPADRLAVLLADEFAATLDRTTAAVIARNVRRWISRRTGEPDRPGLCLLAATSHDDLLEPLEPDVLIVQQPGGTLEMLKRNRHDP